MNIWGITDIGIVRQQNQDAMYFETMSDQQSLAVVCDGMGGAAAGNVASELAITTFTGAVKAALGDQSGDLEQLLRRAAEDANTAVINRAQTDPACGGMGTTLVAALTMGNTAYVVNIGDSRAYYITPEGISRITRDHSLVEDLVERGEITPEEARMHPQRNLITRALGAEEQIEADIYIRSLDAGSYLLLCSDGLSNLMEDQEILYEVIHGGDAASCCERLVEIVCLRGAPDNVTVLLLQEGGSKR